MDTFGLTDNVFVKACLLIAGGKTLVKDSSPEEASDEETPNGIDVAIRLIDLRWTNWSVCKGSVREKRCRRRLI